MSSIAIYLIENFEFFSSLLSSTSIAAIRPYYVRSHSTLASNSSTIIKCVINSARIVSIRINGQSRLRSPAAMKMNLVKVRETTQKNIKFKAIFFLNYKQILLSKVFPYIFETPPICTN